MGKKPPRKTKAERVSRPRRTAGAATNGPAGIDLPRPAPPSHETEGTEALETLAKGFARLIAAAQAAAFAAKAGQRALEAIREALAAGEKPSARVPWALCQLGDTLRAAAAVAAVADDLAEKGGPAQEAVARACTATAGKTPPAERLRRPHVIT